MDDEQMFPYAVILFSDEMEIGRTLLLAKDREGAEYEADGILNRLVDEGFAYEDFVIVRLEGAEAAAARKVIGG